MKYGILIVALLAACSDKSAKPSGDPPSPLGEAASAVRKEKEREPCPLPATIGAAVADVEKLMKLTPEKEASAPKGAYIAELSVKGVAESEVELHVIGDVPAGRSEIHAYYTEAKGRCMTEGCVQLVIRPSASGWSAFGRQYASVSGVVELEAPDGKVLTGSVANVELVEFSGTSHSSHASEKEKSGLVEGGCTTRIEKLTFRLDLAAAKTY